MVLPLEIPMEHQDLEHAKYRHKMAGVSQPSVPDPNEAACAS